MMQWVLLVAAMAGLIMLSRFYPRVAIALFGGLLLALSVGIWFTSDMSHYGQRKVTIKSVGLENMLVVASYAGSYRLTGRIKNNDANSGLDEVVVKVLMDDCVGESCIVVGQALERINLSVPVGQARDFSGSVNLGEPVIMGEVGFRFEVVEVRS